VYTEWFFLAREGQIGPFKTESEARKELKRHVVSVQALSRFQSNREARKAQEDRYSEVARPRLELVKG